MLLILLSVLTPLQQAYAQSFCASDGQSRPVRLVERFINADCEVCWQDMTVLKTGDDDATLDWVVPNDAGGKGDDAALSTVANRDGLTRLEALGKILPEQTLTSVQAVAGAKASKALNAAVFRVAHGPPVLGYMGASMELKAILRSAKKQRWTAWLALVETIPAGSEGTPVVRNLVRNAFQVAWSDAVRQPGNDRQRFFESRSMSIAQGVNPDKLRVVGWIEDALGQVLTAAQSRCIGP